MSDELEAAMEYIATVPRSSWIATELLLPHVQILAAEVDRLQGAVDDDCLVFADALRKIVASTDAEKLELKARIAELETMVGALENINSNLTKEYAPDIIKPVEHT